MEEIKAGDVVQLKSGGTKMTVESIEEYGENKVAKCSWFVKTEYKSENIFVIALKKYENPQPSRGFVL